MAVNIRDNYLEYEIAIKKGEISADNIILGEEKIRLKDISNVYLTFRIISILYNPETYRIIYKCPTQVSNP